MTPLEVAACGFLACLTVKFVVGFLNDNISVDAVWELCIVINIGVIAAWASPLSLAEGLLGSAMAMMAVTVWGLLQFLRTYVLNRLVGNIRR